MSKRSADSAELALGLESRRVKQPRRHVLMRPGVETVERQRVYAKGLQRTGLNNGIRQNGVVQFSIPNRRDGLLPKTMRFTFSVALEYKNTHGRKTRFTFQPRYAYDQGSLSGTNVDTENALDQSNTPGQTFNNIKDRQLLLQNAGEALQGGVQKLFRSLTVKDGYGNVLDQCNHFNIAETTVVKKQSGEDSAYHLLLRGMTTRDTSRLRTSHPLYRMVASRYNEQRQAFEYTVDIRTSWILSCVDDIPLWATNGLQIEFKCDTNAMALIHRYRGVLQDPTVNYEYQIMDAWVDYDTRKYNASTVQSLQQQFESKQGLVLVGEKYSTVYSDTKESSNGMVSIEVDEDFSDVKECIVNAYVFPTLSFGSVERWSPTQQLAHDQFDSNVAAASQSVFVDYMGKRYPEHLAQHNDQKVSMATRVSQTKYDSKQAQTEAFTMLIHDRQPYSAFSPQQWSGVSGTDRAVAASNSQDHSVSISLSKLPLASYTSKSSLLSEIGSGIDLNYNGNDPLRLRIKIRDWRNAFPAEDDEINDADRALVAVDSNSNARVQVVLRHSIVATFRKGKKPNIAN